MAGPSSGGEGNERVWANQDDLPTVPIARQQRSPQPVGEMPTQPPEGGAALGHGGSPPDESAIPTQKLPLPVPDPLPPTLKLERASPPPSLPSPPASSSPSASSPSASGARPRTPDAEAYGLVSYVPPIDDIPTVRGVAVASRPRVALDAKPKRRKWRLALTSAGLLIALAGVLLVWLGGVAGVSALSFLNQHPAGVVGSSAPATSTATSGPTSHATPVPARPQVTQVYPIASLSPKLAAYLKGQGQVGVTIYDLTRNRLYDYDDTAHYYMGSSAKIPIMLEYFHYIESHGESPSQNDIATLTTMIENSNNDSAQYFYSEFSYDAGLGQYLTQAGAPDFTPSGDGFGWFAIAPRDMVHLLTEFYEGKLTNSSDRALGLSLMENIEPDQRHGVGATAPKGTTFAMKDGWIIAPDGLWAANSSGIVMTTGETYIISVYTQDYSSLDSAFDVLDTVCGQSATSLLPHVAGAVSG